MHDYETLENITKIVIIYCLMRFLNFIIMYFILKKIKRSEEEIQ